MKPPPFDYVAPTSLEEALAVLATHGEEAKVLAGGQSLAPMLNFRLARPGWLVDFNRIPALAYIRERAGGLATRQPGRLAVHTNLPDGGQLIQVFLLVFGRRLEEVTPQPASPSRPVHLIE